MFRLYCNDQGVQYLITSKETLEEVKEVLGFEMSHFEHRSWKVYPYNNLNGFLMENEGMIQELVVVELL